MIKFKIVLGFWFCTGFMTGQTIISKNIFEIDNIPLGYHFLPNANRIVFEKGMYSNDKPSVKIIKEIIGYDSDGFYEKFIDKDSLSSCFFSPTEKSFIGVQYNKSKNAKPKFKFVLDGKSSDFFNIDTKLQYFNDEAQFAIVNQNNDTKINLEKDELILDVTNFENRLNTKISFQKPNIARLLGEKNINYADKIPFGVRVNEINFGIITKSIATDYRSTILFRTIYDYLGQKMRDLKYSITINNKFLMYCNNGGGTIYTNPKTDETIVNDMNINNFSIDPTTDNVYVYGLISENAKNASNILNQPAGFYVFKFDKNGNKIWESIQLITNDKKFNSSQNIAKLNLTLTVRKDDVSVILYNNESAASYVFFCDLDINTGNKIKNNTIDFKIGKPINKNLTSFLNSNYIRENIVNKFFDAHSLVTLASDNTFKDYVTNKKSIEALFYKSFIGKQGTWVIESDNATFFNALFFK